MIRAVWSYNFSYQKNFDKHANGGVIVFFLWDTFDIKNIIGDIIVCSNFLRSGNEEWHGCHTPGIGIGYVYQT